MSIESDASRELARGVHAGARPGGAYAVAAADRPPRSQAAWDYWVDAWQRTVLFWDVLRQHSEQYYAEKAKPVPHVLSFDAELVLDGRTFERPVNYGLVRIKPGL